MCGRTFCVKRVLPSFFIPASYNEGIMPRLLVCRDPFITSVNMIVTVNESRKVMQFHCSIKLLSLSDIKTFQDSSIFKNFVVELSRLYSG